MVIGLDRWRDHFDDYADHYVLVGGVACDQVMTDAGLTFRVTKDFDVVLLVEALTPDFGAALWAFIEAGGYERKEKSEGGNVYRFVRPTTPDYPYMIELFSRTPDGIVLSDDARMTPIPIDEAIASLSAILLDADYYAFLQANTRNLDGLPLLHETALIPFKASAFLDLQKRRDAGEKIDNHAVKKHRNDVFRLLQLLPEGKVFELPESIAENMREFVDAVMGDDTFKPSDLGVNLSRDEAAAVIVAAYGL
ncbi:MAG TPA: hypothetical protein VGL66_08930 [Caulobacteraceae bacterium]